MSLSRDFGNVKQNGAASASELADFLAQLRGKRPQEVLGLVAQSGLTHGVTMATLLTIVVLAAWTLVPFAWDRVSPPEKKVAAKQAAPQPSAEGAVPDATTNEPNRVDPTEAAIDGTKPAKPKEDILEKLGQSESKTADPKKNPLEDKTDDLLKDLK